MYLISYFNLACNQIKMETSNIKSNNFDVCTISSSKPDDDDDDYNELEKSSLLLPPPDMKFTPSSPTDYLMSPCSKKLYGNVIKLSFK